ncbi:MAG: ATP-binding protein [Bdellovibrionales bacterium]
MALSIVTAEERLETLKEKNTIAIFGPSGFGKTFLARTLPPEPTLVIDLEAGLKSLKGWGGDSVSIHTFSDALDIACLIGGVKSDAASDGFFSQDHYGYVSEKYSDLASTLAQKKIIFVDSITEMTRQAMAWAKTRPEAFSEKTGNPDIRGAYGLLAREVIGLLKHLQHAQGKTVIFVGILESIQDDTKGTVWLPQMEGGKVGRELPGIVDQVMTLSLFSETPNGYIHNPDKGEIRRLVCHAVNPWGLPAKDRTGNLDLTEPPDLGFVLDKMNAISTNS